MPRARAGSGGDPRERWTEGIFGLAFVAAAVSMAVWLPAEPVSVASAVWLVGLFFVLCQVGVRRRRGAHPARAARGGADAASPDPFGRSAARGRRDPPGPRAVRRHATRGAAGPIVARGRLVQHCTGSRARARRVTRGTAGHRGRRRAGHRRAGGARCRHGDLAAALRSRPPCAGSAQRLRLGLHRGRTPHSRRDPRGRRRSPAARGPSRRCCRSPRCSPCSRASGRVASRTRGHCTAWRRRTRRGWSRSCRTRAT